MIQIISYQFLHRVLQLFFLGVVCAFVVDAFAEPHVAEMGCPVFGLSQLGFLIFPEMERNKCDALTKTDTNANGVPNWSKTIDGKKSSVFIPLDEDIDGDGISNIFDEHPLKFDFVKKSENLKNTIPDFLVHPKEHFKNVTPQLENAQLELYRQSDILAIHYPLVLSLPKLEAFSLVVSRGMPKGIIRKISRLKYIYTQKQRFKLGMPLAYFVNDLKAIVFSGGTYDKNPNTQVELLETISHEIGHAVVFSLFSPEKLVAFAREFGPWGKVLPVLNIVALRSLFDPVLFVSHPLYNESSEMGRRELSVPSNYSLYNIHEWFAEIFSVWVMRNLCVQNLVESSNQYHLSPTISAAISSILSDDI